MEIQIATLGNLSKSRRFDCWESLREHSRRNTKIYCSTTCNRVIVDYKINIINVILGPQNGSPICSQEKVMDEMELDEAELSISLSFFM